MAFGGCVRKMCWPDAYGFRSSISVRVIKPQLKLHLILPVGHRMMKMPFFIAPLKQPPTVLACLSLALVQHLARSIESPISSFLIQKLRRPLALMMALGHTSRSQYMECDHEKKCISHRCCVHAQRLLLV
ncbi:hypothetical protein C6382_08610 [Pseudomonas sp. BBP2017]|nr:hypothetical protein C6382_08610 [Pseudomonas sp. BBP2017]